MADRLQGPLGPRRRLLSPSGCGACIAGFNGSTRYEMADSGPAGSTTMSRVVAYRLDVLTGVAAVFHQRFRATVRGWRQTWLGANGPSFGVITAAIALASSPTFVHAAADVGKVWFHFGTFDGAAVRAFRTSARVVSEVGGGTLAIGYTMPSAVDDYAIGAQGTSDGAAQPLTGAAVLGTAGSDTAQWTLAEMQAIVDDAIANCGRIGAVPGESFRWLARDVVPPAAWTGQSGGTLTLLGAVQAQVVRQKFQPVYG